MSLNAAQLDTVGQLAAFLEGTREVDFRAQGTNDGERYGFVTGEWAAHATSR